MRHLLTEIYQRHSAKEGESEAAGMERFGMVTSSCFVFAKFINPHMDNGL